MEIKEQIRRFVINAISEIHGNEQASQIDDDTSLIETGLVDSLMVLDLISFLEQSFGISLSGNNFDPGEFESISRISEWTSRKISKRT